MHNNPTLINKILPADTNKFTVREYCAKTFKPTVEVNVRAPKDIYVKPYIMFPAGIEEIYTTPNESKGHITPKNGDWIVPKSLYEENSPITAILMRMLDLIKRSAAKLGFSLAVNEGIITSFIGLGIRVNISNMDFLILVIDLCKPTLKILKWKLMNSI